MNAQRDALRPWVYGREGVILKIIPRDALLPVLPMTNFIIFNEKFVFIELTSRGVRIFSEDEVSEYRILFRLLEDLAVSGEKAERLISLED